MRQEQIVELAVKRIRAGKDIEDVLWKTFGGVLDLVLRGGDLMRDLRNGDSISYDDLISFCEDCEREIDAEEEEGPEEEEDTEA